MSKLVILGASGNALDVLDVVDALNAQGACWEVLGLLDDERSRETESAGLPILGGLAEAARFTDCLFINAIGSDRSYRRRPDFIAATDVSAERFATLVHPLAAVSRRARIGRGVCVNAGASLAGNVHVGDHVSVGPGVIVGHDSVLEDHALLAPGAVVSGFCHVGRAAYVGAGAAVRQRVRLGEHSLVGMGAVVLKDVPAGACVIGNPVRVLERPAFVVAHRMTANETCHLR
jgi:sugar O-acyltransferase (sialic acid O-acetyltransferase NeuD family)